MKSLLPWIAGAVVLAGALVAQSNALIYYRATLLVAVAAATLGAIGGARVFDRGDQLFLSWSILASGYVLLGIRYVLRLFVALKMMEMPATLDRVLLIAHNVAVPVALMLFVLAWRKTGLSGPISGVATFGMTVAGALVAIAIGTFPLMSAIHDGNIALIVSTVGDMASIALIVPLLMPALGMRGGLLMHLWLYLAMSQVVWLFYDIWSVGRARTGIIETWGLAIDQALRAVALVYIYVAGSAQKKALVQVDDTLTGTRSASSAHYGLSLR